MLLVILLRDFVQLHSQLDVLAITEALDHFYGNLFVVHHVMLPRLRKFRDSRSLLLVNVHELLLLRHFHVMALPILFVPTPLVEDATECLRLQVLLRMGRLFEKFRDQLYQADHLVVGDEVDAVFGHECTILFLYAHEAASDGGLRGGDLQPRRTQHRLGLIQHIL